MAKKPENEYQDDLFPVDPKIVGLAISEFKIKDGAVDAKLSGVTLTNDIALIDATVWKKAVAAWLVTQCGGSLNTTYEYIDEALAEAKARQDDLDAAAAAQATYEAEKSKRDNVKQFGNAQALN